MKELDFYIDRAKELGAKDAKVIKTDTIETAAWVRAKCQFGCDGYGGSLRCPPNTPGPEETARIIAGYDRALLVHVVKGKSVSKMVITLETEIFLDGYYKALAFGAGPCTICDECPDTCRYPEKSRPSMEAMGIDVYKTARNNGYPIEVVRTRKDKANYYGVVLID